MGISCEFCSARHIKRWDQCFLKSRENYIKKLFKLHSTFMFMSVIFKYMLFSLQGHIRILQGHNVCARTRYFNAWLGRTFSPITTFKYLKVAVGILL